MSSVSNKSSATRVWCAVLALALLAMAFASRPRIVELCRVHLSETDEPASWRALPELESPRDGGLQLGPFRIHGHSAMPKYGGLGVMDSVLYDPKDCRSSGVSLAAWFEHGPGTDYLRTPSELHLRRASNGVFVVSGAVLDGQPRTPETFVTAFRQEEGLSLSLASPEAPWFVLVLAIGFGFACRGWLSPAHSCRGRRVAGTALALACLLNGWAIWLEIGPTLLG